MNLLDQPELSSFDWNKGQLLVTVLRPFFVKNWPTREKIIVESKPFYCHADPLLYNR